MIRHCLLDLDNTLYPASGGMDEGVTRRMLEYVALYLGVSFEEGVALRAAELKPYGTTLEWLKTEHNLRDETPYFEAMHPDNEIDELQKDDELRPYLLSLGLPLTLLTNAPMAHAERVLRFLNIDDIFLGIFDLTFHNGIGKPHASCFRSTLDAVGFSVEETVFVDDHPKFARGYKALGGQVVLVDESGRYTELAKAEGFGHIKSIYELKQLILDSKDGNR